MQVDTIMKQLLFNAVYIETQVPDGTSSGTGFIYNAAIGTDSILPTLVTNKHVIAGASQLKIRLIGAIPPSNDRPDLGNPINVLYRSPESLWTEHPDPEVDVAAMFLGPTLNDIEKQGRSAFFRMGGRELYPNDALLGDLDAIEDVLFIGYPNGIFDSVNHTPIDRRGVTATPVQLDWSGTPTFLIDALVFPGSSGSPVFFIQQGLVQQDGNITIGAPPRILLLGIVASVMIQPTTGAIVTRSAGKRVAVNQMIDLGVVYNWRAIEETVAALCREHQVDRSVNLAEQQSQPPAPPADVDPTNK
ncbi:MAG: serine protease [Pseudonocardia sp.]|nr:serine protease [Pseudonocardia sp.]